MQLSIFEVMNVKFTRYALLLIIALAMPIRVFAVSGSWDSYNPVGTAWASNSPHTTEQGTGIYMNGWVKDNAHPGDGTLVANIYLNGSFHAQVYMTDYRSDLGGVYGWHYTIPTGGLNVGQTYNIAVAIGNNTYGGWQTFVQSYVEQTGSFVLTSPPPTPPPTGNVTGQSSSITNWGGSYSFNAGSNVSSFYWVVTGPNLFWTGNTNSPTMMWGYGSGPGQYQFYVVMSGPGGTQNTNAITTIVEAPYFHVDHVQGTDPSLGTYSVVSGENFTAHGWAFDRQNGAPLYDKIIMIVNGVEQPVNTVATGGHRWDVHNALSYLSPGNDLNYSGWNVSYSTAGLPLGQNTVKIQARNSFYGGNSSFRSEASYYLNIYGEQASVWSQGAELQVNQAFTPSYNGGSGNGAWQFKVEGHTNWPSSASTSGTSSGSSWTPSSPGVYQFYIRKQVDGNILMSNEAGPYNLTVKIPQTTPVVAQGNITLQFGQPFIPVFSGGNGSGAYQFVLHGPGGVPLSNFPGTENIAVGAAGTMLGDTNQVVTSWTPPTLGQYRYWVRRAGDSTHFDSAVNPPSSLEWFTIDVVKAEQSLQSAPQTIPLGQPFTPVITDHVGGPWQFIVKNYTNVPGAYPEYGEQFGATQSGTLVGTPPDLSIQTSWLPPHEGVYDFYVYSPGDETTHPSTSDGTNVVPTGPYKLTVGDSPWQPGGPLEDYDNDGMDDNWETLNGLNPNLPADGLLDFDGDGLSNAAEYSLEAMGTPNNGFGTYDTSFDTVGGTVPAGWDNLVTPASGNSHAVGSTPGTLSVSPSGAATYSVPLWVTPGSAGMEPKLSLEYSSQTGQGNAGYGWNLSGVSAITRGPQRPDVLATDPGSYVGVKLTNSDRFYLDGKELIAITGNNGENETVYRTKIDTFTKVVSYDSDGSGPDYFKAWTKAGLVIEYGHSPDSARDAGGGLSKLSWHVNKITDTSGNYISFIYSEDSAQGLHYLTEIKYTGNDNRAQGNPFASVVFAYNDLSGSQLGYFKGVPLRDRQKYISDIKVYYGSTLLKTYTLNHTEGAFGTRAYLDSITETGKDGSSYPDLIFTYDESPAPGWSSAASFEPPDILADDTKVDGKRITGAGFLDLDGDGLPDFVSFPNGGSSIVRRNNGSGFDSSPMGDYVLPHPLGPIDGQDSGSRFIDINGDGLLDFIWDHRYSGGSHYSSGAKINTGSSWSTDINNYTPPMPLAVKDHSRLPGTFVDLDGDGMVDFVSGFTPTGGPASGLEIRLNKNNGWVTESSTNFDAVSPDANLPGGRFIDVNGDGLPDYVVAHKQSLNTEGWGGNNFLMTYINTGSGWIAEQPQKENGEVNPNFDADKTYLSPVVLSDDKARPYGVEFVDVNLDGLVDIIQYRDPGPVVGLYINTGEGWSEGTTLAAGTFADLVAPVALGRQGDDVAGSAILDFNSDGLPDFTVRRELSSLDEDNRIWLGNGSSWEFANTGHAFEDLKMPTPLQPYGVNAPGVNFVDLNGDGAIDILFSRIITGDSTVKGAWLNTTEPHGRLESVTNGMGVTATIYYKPMTDTSVYTRLNSNLTGMTKVANQSSTGYVVSSIEHDDGTKDVNGAVGIYTMDYSYSGLRSHPWLGSLGFEKIEVRDSRTGIESVTEYKQNYPYVGLIAKSTTVKNGVELSKQIVSYGFLPLNSGKTVFPYAETTTASSRDLDGKFLSQSETTVLQGGSATSSFDGFGNALYLKTTTGTSDLGTSPGQTAVITTETINTYDNITSNDKWHLGRLRKATVTTSDGTDSITRESSFTYYPTTGLLHTETVEPDATNDEDTFGQFPNLKLTTTYTYELGNKKTVSLSGDGLGANRVTTFDYDTDGRFATGITNAANHTETRLYNNFGGVTILTGPNNLPTTWQYDGFGRKEKETRPDNTVTEIHRYWATGTNGQLSDALSLVYTTTSGAPPTVEYFDRLGRSIGGYTLNGGGRILNGSYDNNARIVGTKTSYDDRGRTYRTTRPYYYLEEAPSLDSLNDFIATETTYDDLDRPVAVKSLDDQGNHVTTSIVYSGLKVESTIAGQKSRIVRDAVGRTYTSEQNVDAGASALDYAKVTYVHDPLGNVTKTKLYRDSANTVDTTIEYDVRGRKIKMIDPQMGTWHYRYNAVGELVWQRDAMAQTVDLTYDVLGRMETRSESEGVTTWTYDTYDANDNGQADDADWLGALRNVQVTGSNGYSETQDYDGYGRPTTLTRHIDGRDYSTHQSYDSYSRPTVISYPHGFKTRNYYNAFGFLREVRNDANSMLTSFPGEISNNQVFWRAHGYDRWGRIDMSMLGNGSAQNLLTSDFNGQVAAITALTPFWDHIDLVMTYNGLGNLTGRINQVDDRTEFFNYDGLNRLTSWTLNGATQSYEYDRLGNFTSKAGSAYTYQTDVGAERLKAAQGMAISYATATVDNVTVSNGNISSIGDRSLTWTTFNQVKTITKAGLTSTFEFGANRERVMQSKSNGQKVIYVGSLYEELWQGTTLVESKHYITTPVGRVAVRTVRSDATVETRYYHQDHQGSILAVSDEVGRIDKRFAYDPWGQRTTIQDSHTGSYGDHSRGYTDHEMLEDFGLIHMNGRVYDPVLGRFLSADPFVDDATDAQAYNRYSYVSNNPLNHTDPSGFFKLKDIVPAIVGIVVAAITLVALGPGSGTFFKSLTASLKEFGAHTIWAGASGGFASGFSGSLLNGGSLGDAFKAGVIGAATGAATAWAAGQIGGFFDGAASGDGLFGGGFSNWSGRIVAHATVGGLASEAQGGQFRHGFFSSAASTGFMHSRIGGRLMENKHIVVRTATAAAIGGTASALGGGKFANGAVTSAFQHLFNAEAADLLAYKFKSSQFSLKPLSPSSGGYVESDGSGGLRAVVGSDFSSAHAIIKKGIVDHETEHINQAMAVNKDIAKGAKSGLVLVISGRLAKDAAEYQAYNVELNSLRSSLKTSSVTLNEQLEINDRIFFVKSQMEYIQKSSNHKGIPIGY